MQEVPKKANDALHLKWLYGLKKDLENYGQVLLQNTFVVWDPKALIKKGRERHIFLFDSCLVLAKIINSREGDGGKKTKLSYQYKMEISTSCIQVTEHIDADPCKFALWEAVGEEVPTAPVTLYKLILKAKSLEEKQQWVRQLREIIRERMDILPEAVVKTPKVFPARETVENSLPVDDPILRRSAQGSLQGSLQSVHSGSTTQGYDSGEETIEPDPSSFFVMGETYDNTENGGIWIEAGTKVLLLDMSPEGCTEPFKTVLIRALIGPDGIEFPDGPKEGTVPMELLEQLNVANPGPQIVAIMNREAAKKRAAAERERAEAEAAAAEGASGFSMQQQPTTSITVQSPGDHNPYEDFATERAAVTEDFAGVTLCMASVSLLGVREQSSNRNFQNTDNKQTSVSQPTSTICTPTRMRPCPPHTAAGELLSTSNAVACSTANYRVKTGTSEASIAACYDSSETADDLDDVDDVDVDSFLPPPMPNLETATPALNQASAACEASQQGEVPGNDDPAAYEMAELADQAIASDPSKEEILNRRMRLVLDELVTTERDYVMNLGIVVESYLPILRPHPQKTSVPKGQEDYLVPVAKTEGYSSDGLETFDSGNGSEIQKIKPEEDSSDDDSWDGPHIPRFLRDSATVIFSNIEQIFDFHRDVLLPEIERSFHDAEETAKVFLRFVRRMGMYVKYCENKCRSEFLVAENNDIFGELQAFFVHKLSMKDLLIMPVQRMMKYHLLLKEIEKLCQKLDRPNDFVSKSVRVMSELPYKANKMMMLGRLQGYDGKLTALGDVIQHGDMNIWEFGDQYTLKTVEPSFERRNVFLFEQGVIISKKRECRSKSTLTNPALDFKMLIMVNKMQVGRSNPEVFEFRLLNMPPKTNGVICRVDDGKLYNSWLTSFDRLMTMQRNFQSALQAPISYQKALSENPQNPESTEPFTLSAGKGATGQDTGRKDEKSGKDSPRPKRSILESLKHPFRSLMGSHGSSNTPNSKSSSNLQQGGSPNSSQAGATGGSPLTATTSAPPSMPAAASSQNPKPHSFFKKLGRKSGGSGGGQSSQPSSDSANTSATDLVS